LRRIPLSVDGHWWFFEADFGSTSRNETSMQHFQQGQC
jgi:hypothetical protein